MKQTAGNYPAPLKILDVVKEGLSTSGTEGYDAESKVIFAWQSLYYGDAGHPQVLWFARKFVSLKSLEQRSQYL